MRRQSSSRLKRIEAPETVRPRERHLTVRPARVLGPLSCVITRRCDSAGFANSRAAVNRFADVVAAGGPISPATEERPYGNGQAAPDTGALSGREPSGSLHFPRPHPARRCLSNSRSKRIAQPRPNNRESSDCTGTCLVGLGAGHSRLALHVRDVSPPVTRTGSTRIDSASPQRGW
jgi:hypothetical protein